ncbi:alpha/beta fold hydrolase [Lacrimispora saccharolytica]|uniref:Alpha/beta hydrolase fold protein n=1 Tax=Lacrimispora saccharolytica (strain ATCC 35040 / DSM 2544 / NRCC 2533 / WM1) TaxID=610130 RepID=D9R241_LACSW|nr:alpha/beta hydrolase [Lacrimispora saccharolytica]ADL04691.1 alpha/beta hydrolase fold protein [[Clostridium] saccharolyticum WM1]QRV21080.1 alpha/beta hydrolase [Lacrimispora saccharolytica]
MYIDVNGITLFYEVSGSGPAILLVHGNGEDHRIFDETAELLKKDYTVYALDSRDHGKSTRVKTLGYHEMAEDVAEFIRIMELERPYFCGFSDGGILGILAAARHPDLFSKLVLCGANANPQGLKWYWYKIFALMETLSHDRKLRMILLEPRITAKELESITIPTLILAGERDMIRESHTRYLASRIKDSSLRILPGEGHGSYIVHSRKLYYFMKKFLEKPLS